jgi:ubiquinol oxidase
LLFSKILPAERPVASTFVPVAMRPWQRRPMGLDAPEDGPADQACFPPSLPDFSMSSRGAGPMRPLLVVISALMAIRLLRHALAGWGAKCRMGLSDLANLPISVGKGNPMTDIPAAPAIPLDRHKTPDGISDRIALGIVKFMRVFADAFFSKRYGHRAVVLETVAAVPGMVGGLLQHLKSLRHIREDQGWIRELLDEAENERMHLMTFIKIAQPSFLERMLIMFGQAVFFNAYFFLYLFAPKTAHRVVGYLEEEAVVSYTSYLAQVDIGAIENIAAPQIAIDYWHLPADARLREVIIAVRADEARHRDTNHEFADTLAKAA